MLPKRGMSAQGAWVVISGRKDCAREAAAVEIVAAGGEAIGEQMEHQAATS
jgi:hypothetical protein